jgi:hypothetical protein
MEAVLGLAPDSKFGAGVDVSIIDPLPGPDEFEMKGYSPVPDGTCIDPVGGVSHPLYPPGLGAPQWTLSPRARSRLVLIARVPPGEVLAYETRRLAPIR